MKPASKHKIKRSRKAELYSLRQMLHLYSLPVIVICVGMGLSILSFVMALNGNINRLSDNFKSDGSKQYSLLTRQFDTYVAGQKIAQAGLSYYEKFTVENFKRITSPLLTDHKFTAFMMVSIQGGITTVNSVNYQQGKTVQAGTPLADIKAIQEGIVKAGKTRDLVTTEIFSIKGDSAEKNKMALIMPITNNGAARNYIVGILDVPTILAGVLRLSDLQDQTIIHLYDNTDNKFDLVFYKDKNGLHYSSPDKRQSYEYVTRRVPFSFEETILLPSRSLRIVFAPTQDYLSRAADFFSWSILVFGMLITVILSAFIFSLVTGNIKTQSRVDEQTLALRNMTQELRESGEKISAIVDNTVDGIITIDEKGTIESFNRACEKIFGYTADEALGQNINMLMPEPHQSQHDQYLKGYKETGIGKIVGVGREVEGRRKNGTLFPIDLAVGVVNIQGRRIYCGTLRDITERKKMYELLQKSNKDLEQFAYIASHDLRAPLRAIDQLAGWLQEDLDDRLDDESREHMEMLRGRVARMETLLNDLLEYSRVGRNVNKDSAIVRGNELIEDITLLLSPPPGFNIFFSPSLRDIQLQKLPLHQVLLNLISNAIKHHDKNTGRVEVRVTNRGHAEYEFTVSDDGPGIPRKLHKKAFEMFQTLQPRDKVEGSGMGLALVKKIVSNIGGEITMDSEVGCGTKISFTWPVQSGEDNTV